MTFDPEPIYAALFNLVSAVDAGAGLTFQTKSRHLQAWSEVDPANQPALYMRQGAQIAAQNNLALTDWKLPASLWIYFRADGSQLQSGVVPDQAINTYIKAISAALDPVHGERQTLGGLCYHCYIDGPIPADDGLLDNQAVLIIPIVIKMGV